ncbi:MAG: terminase family protein [Candidatus Thiodiazotropha sp.]
MTAARKINPALDELMRWQDDPVYFIETVFAVGKRQEDDELLDKWQKEAASALAAGHNLSIRSGHGVGKTSFLAMIIIWWMLTKSAPRIACTAPSAPQLEKNLWGEIATWHEILPPALKQQLEIKADTVVATRNPRKLWCAARTARKEQPEAFQGMHAPDMLFIGDEASGIHDIIFEMGKGSMSTEGAQTILTGNPTRTSGYFWKTHTKLAKFWYTMKVSCADAKMASQKYVEETAEEYGIDSNVYRVRVLGEFPTTDDNTVIPFEWVDSSVGREVEKQVGRKKWGLDVARFGDDSCALAKREKNHLLEPIKEWRGKDTMQTVGIVVREYNETPDKEKPDEILVDSIGIGAGVVDRLKEQGLPARGVNVAERPSNSEKHLRLRDELWWLGREWFQLQDVCIPDDPAFIGEITTPIYDLSSSGKTQVESKDDMKKRGERSPNRADAFLLTFATTDSKSFNKPIEYPYLGIG